MSSLNPFRSLPITPLKPDIWAQWLSAWKSRLPSEFLNPRSPEFIPAMATAVLIAAAGAQLVLPLPTNLPQETELAPRRVHEATAPPAPDYPGVLQNPIFAPDRKPDASAVPVAGGMNGFIALGIAVAGENAAALVRGPGGTIQRLKPGDDIMGGWKLVAVETDRLTFQRNNERRVLMIQKASAPVILSPNGPSPRGLQAHGISTGTMSTPGSKSSSSSDDDDDTNDNDN